MDLASLKNIDLNDLISKVKSGGFGDKKLLIKFGVGFVAILIFLIGYYAIVSPKVKAQEEQIMIMDENKNKIIEFNTNIVTLRGAVKKLEPEFNKNSKLFHSKKEVEDLYQNISNFALRNGLSIVNLKKGEPIAVVNDNSGENTSGDQSTENSGDQSTENTGNEQTLYFKIPVDYEIRGNFLGYLKFRRALAGSSKVINFDKEEINVLKEVQGQVLSKGTISIVGLPNEYK